LKLFKPRERAFKQLKCPRPQCVKWIPETLFPEMKRLGV